MTGLVILGVIIGAAGYFVFAASQEIPQKPVSESQNSSQFFPIGLLCVDDYTPRDPADPPSKMTVLEEFPEIARAGFNLFHTARFDVASPEWGNTDENAKIFLDTAHKSGLKVMMGVSCADWPMGENIPDDQLNLLLKRVRELKDHPALFGWVIGDDTPQGGWGEEGEPLEPSPEKLRKIRQAIKQADAAHPLVVSLPGAIDQNYEYRDIADIYMLDNFPIGFEVIPPGIPPEWEAHPEDVGKFVDIVRKVIGPQQKAQANVQIYNVATDPLTWESEEGRMPRELGRYPTRAEMRFMAYNALIHKSYGVVFNCYRYDYRNYGRDDAGGREGSDDVSPRGNPSQWKNIADVATELKFMSPIFLAPDSNKKVTIKPSGVEYLLKEYNDKLYLIAANPSVKRNTATFIMSQPAMAINVLNESRSITPQGVSFTDNFDGYGVHCYEISRQLENSP